MKKPKKKVLSAKEKEKRRVERSHTNFIRSVFRNAGFKRYAALADAEFALTKTLSSDFDDVFVYENIIVCAEYTTSKPDGIGDHLRKKNLIYSHAENNPSDLMSALSKIDPTIFTEVSNIYADDELIVRFLYCSRYDFDNKHKENAPTATYLDYAELRYFKSLTDCIKVSARAELLGFLEIPLADLGVDGKIAENMGNMAFAATVLPENNSNFDAGFKVVSFYVDPESLIYRAYVLRRQGWRDSDALYQRMISKSKIESIRKHLKSKKRVFVNNIIATLDDDTKILDKNNDQVDPSKINRTTPVTLQIPNRLNTVGLIDGQHRTFSYYESNPDDPEIAKLRKKLNLLVTGIVYPKGMTNRDRESFEARLFVEINSTQTNAPPDLKQAINRIVDPFSDVSIAASVLEKLSRGSGPLNGHIVRHWFDSNKLRTTSVVSYGMKPLVKLSGTDSLFTLWDEKLREEIVAKKNTDLLNLYIEHCRLEIDRYLIAVKKNLPANLWTPDRSIQGRLITTTVVNSLLICLRILIEKNKTGTTDYYENCFKGLSPADFKGFHSSQYNKLADKLYNKYFL